MPFFINITRKHINQKLLYKKRESKRNFYDFSFKRNPKEAKL